MIVGTCEIELLIPESSSLKDKRRVFNSLKARLRERFNISVSEVDSQNSWRRGTLGVAAIGSSKRFTNQVLSKVLDTIGSDTRVEILHHRMELF